MASMSVHQTDAPSHNVRALAISLPVTALLLPSARRARFGAPTAVEQDNDLRLLLSFDMEQVFAPVQPAYAGVRGELLGALVEPTPVIREFDKTKQRELAHLAAPGPWAQRVTASTADHPEHHPT